MKKISKLLLIIVLIIFISSPLSVLAQPEEKPTPPEEQTTETIPEDEKPKEETLPKEEEKPKEETLSEENVPVDEENQSPFLEETPDQSIRNKEVIKKPIKAPSSVTGEKYRGSGTVVDFTTTGEKAFYTVKSPDNSIFYIVIDMDKLEDNVYFLSEINGEELNLNDITRSVSQEETKPKPEPVEEKNTNFTFWFILIVGSIGFMGYHLFFGKLKNLNPLNKKNNKKTDDDLENKEDIYLEDEDEFLVDDEDEN